MASRQELELVAVLASIGQRDRELYRQLRREAWEMVEANHHALTTEQREWWMRNAS